MKLAVLYAGQGAQHPGMGKEFYEGSPAFRAAFDSAELDFDLHRVCFEGRPSSSSKSTVSRMIHCFFHW